MSISNFFMLQMRRTVTNFSTTKDVAIEMRSLTKWCTTDGHCAKRIVIKIWDARPLNGMKESAPFRQHAHPDFSQKILLGKMSRLM